MSIYQTDLTAIIKPTHYCNLACRYCYLDPHAEQGMMDRQVLKKMIENLFSIEGKDFIHFLWHGGEPLLMGIDFYEEAVDIQKFYSKDGKKCKNSFQSNCTMITSEFLDFCEKNYAFIGCSLDGPEAINDLTRFYPDGRGAFKDAWAGISAIHARNNKLKDETPKGVSPFCIGGGAIVILNKTNINKIDEIYTFFKSNNISPKFNALIKSGQADINYEDLGIESHEYGRALTCLFDNWFSEMEEGIDVYPFQEIMNGILYGDSRMCNYCGDCRNSFIAVGPMGDIYPCGRFDGMPEFWLGNIMKTNLSHILTSDRHQKMKVRNAKDINSCAKCKYVDICNAGCMHDALMQNGSIYKKDYYCASHKMLFDRIGNALAPIIAEAKIEE